MLRVALTGGIASGKSTAADFFRRLNVPVIDTDRIARDVVEPGQPGLAALVETFGRNILDEQGSLHRDRLRQRVFTDPDARKAVNAILHPLILERLETMIAGLGAPYVIVEVPLLAETRQHAHFDRVLLVDVPESIQRERLATRDSYAREEVERALAAQATREERLAIADDVIENNGDLDTLRHAVSDLHYRYLELAKRFATAAPPRPE